MEINKETSYLIGLFQSDGHLYKVKNRKDKGNAQIEISYKDIDILTKIQKIVPYYSSIRERKRNIVMKGKKYNHHSVSFNCCGSEFRKFLNENGVPYGKKSNIISPPKNIIKEDYIRGLFDGDGSLGFTAAKFPFVGFVTESDFIKDYLLDFISDITGKKRKNNNRNKRDNLYNIVITKEDAIKFCEIVYYNDCCLSLDRKYKKSQEIRKWKRPDNMKKINRK